MSNIEAPAPPPVVSVLFVPKTGGRRGCRSWSPGNVERTGVTMKQLLHKNNPWSGAPCYRAASCLSCASDKDSKDNCSKHSVVYEVHCEACRKLKEEKKALGDDSLDHIYVGLTSESCYVRGLGHVDSMEAGMKGKSNTSHMAYHINTTHGGQVSEAKFVMKKVKSYPSTFLRILAECIRIKYRSREKGVLVLNSKAGDFGSYMLPRLSLRDHDQESEPQAQAQRARLPGDDRREAQTADVSISPLNA